jgi:hypothetical protein
MSELLVVTPSRARPHNVERLWEAMQETCRGDTTLLIGLDDDDETRTSYPAGPQYEVHPGMRHKVVGWINALAVPRAGQYKAIGHFGDDCVPRTAGWDVTVMEALEKQPFAFGDDLERSQRPEGSLPTHIFMRSAIVRRLGYVGPPAMQHMWVDFAWMAWGAAAGMTYLPGVVIEHMHFTSGKAPVDGSYQFSRQFADTDLAGLQRYVAYRLDRDVAKITIRHPHRYNESGFYALCTKRRLLIPKPSPLLRQS